MSFTQWKQHGCQIIGWTLKDTYDRLCVAFFNSICWTNHCLEFWGFFVTFVAIYFDVISPSWFKIMSIVKCHLKQLKDVEQLFWSVLTLCSMLIVSLGFVMCKMWCESFRGLRNILKAVALDPVSSVPPLLSYPFATDSIVVMDAYFLPQQRGGSWLICQSWEYCLHVGTGWQ